MFGSTCDSVCGMDPSWRELYIHPQAYYGFIQDSIIDSSMIVLWIHLCKYYRFIHDSINVPSMRVLWIHHLSNAFDRELFTKNIWKITIYIYVYLKIPIFNRLVCRTCRILNVWHKDCVWYNVNKINKATPFLQYYKTI